MSPVRVLDGPSYNSPELYKSCPDTGSHATTRQIGATSARFVKAIATGSNASFVMASWRRDYAGDCNSPHPWFEPRARPPFLSFCPPRRRDVAYCWPVHAADAGTPGANENGGNPVEDCRH